MCLGAHALLKSSKMSMTDEEDILSNTIRWYNLFDKVQTLLRALSGLWIVKYLPLLNEKKLHYTGSPLYREKQGKWQQKIRFIENTGILDILQKINRENTGNSAKTQGSPQFPVSGLILRIKDNATFAMKFSNAMKTGVRLYATWPG